MFYNCKSGYIDKSLFAEIGGSLYCTFENMLNSDKAYQIEKHLRIIEETIYKCAFMTETPY